MPKCYFKYEHTIVPFRYVSLLVGSCVYIGSCDKPYNITEEQVESFHQEYIAWLDSQTESQADDNIILSVDEINKRMMALKKRPRCPAWPVSDRLGNSTPTGVQTGARRIQQKSPDVLQAYMGR